MPDIQLASTDLAAGLTLKKVYLPATKVDVVLQNPPAELVKAAKKDKLVLQSVIAAAFDSLQSAKKEFQTAMLQLEAKFEKTPLTNEKDLAQRAETLQVTYKQIATAQGTAAAKAAEAAWAIQAKKKSDLKAFRVKFFANTVAGTLSIAASVTTAVLSMGSLAVTIVSAAKTMLQLAKGIYDYFRAMAKVEKDIIASDQVIQEAWKKKSNGGKILGRDLAEALGAPFVKSVNELRKLLEEYNAKSAKCHNDAEKMWKQTKDLMAELGKMPEGVGNKEQKAKLEKAVTTLLEQISQTVSSTKDQDLFYDTYMKRVQKYDKWEADLRIARLGPATELLSFVAGLASTAETVAKIAEKLH